MSEGTWRQLGLLLVEKDLISREELSSALTEQQASGGRLGEILIARGYASRQAIQDVLAEQCGVMFEPEHGFGTGLRRTLARRHLDGRRATRERPAAAAAAPAVVAAAPPGGAPAFAAAASAAGFGPVDLRPAPELEARPAPLRLADPPAEPPAEERAGRSWFRPGPREKRVLDVADYEAQLAEREEELRAALRQLERLRKTLQQRDAELAAERRLTAALSDELKRALAAQSEARAEPASEPRAEPEPEREPEPEPSPEPDAERESSPAPSQQPVAGSTHLRFLLASTGYRLETCDGAAPEPGSTVETEAGRSLVVKVGASPLPRDDRRCAFLLREPAGA